MQKVEVSTDGGVSWRLAAGTTSWNYVWTMPADGVHILKSRATDNSGNVETPGAGVTVNVDKTAPTSVISAPSAGDNLAGTNYTITGTASDGAGSGVRKVEISINGGAWQTAGGTASWSYTWTPPADGVYTIKSRATDNAGNVETPGPGVTVTEDNTKPASTIASLSDGTALSGKTINITGTASDGAGSGVRKVEVSINGGAWQTAVGTASWSYTWTPPADGVYTIKSRATDNVGNVETPGPGVTVTEDNTKPASTIASLSDGTALSGKTINITGTAMDGTGSGVRVVEVSINGGAWQTAVGTASWSLTWTPPADGVYILKSRATDNAGNVETPGPGVTVTVDNAPPVASIACPADGVAIKGTTISLSGTASDGGGSGVAKVEISADGGNTWDTATGTTGWSYDLTIPAPGNYSMWRVASAMIRDGQSSDSITVRVKHLLKADGSKVRAGFVSGPTQAITIDEAYIGNDAGGGAVSGNVPLTFGGESSVTVPAGEIIFSDPVSWNAVRGGTIVVTSYGTGLSSGWTCDFASYYEDGNVAGVSRPLANKTYLYVGSYAVWNALVVEVLSEGTTANENVLLLGDSITLGYSAESGAKSWADLLGAKVNVFNAAHSGTTAAYETEALAGILGHGINYDKAIVSLGTNDIESGYTEDDIKTNLGAIFTALESLGIAVIAGNITPRSESGSKETTRLDINDWLKTLPYGIKGVIDFDAAVRDPASPNKMLPGYDDGHGVHPNGLGYAAMFGAIDKEHLFTAGMVIDINARATDNAENVESPYPAVKIIVDNSAPASAIVNPVNDGTLHGTTFTVRGTADDAAGSGIDKVEVSTDGGNTWRLAAGTTAWSYAWTLLPSGGPGTLKSRATDNAGNVETPGRGATVTITPYSYGAGIIGTRDLPHCNWNAVFIPDGTDCTFCHIVPDKFLASDFRQSPGFCNSCHNPSGSGHALAINGSPGQHVMFANATAAGRKRPSFGCITTGQWNDIPASRLENDYQVTCITCHNDMRKPDDPGRTWEYTTTSDNQKYCLQNGGWTEYGNLAPKVYRDTSLWSGPTYSKTRKNYLVDPSEYTYNEMSGFIRFKAQQASTAYIYATLYYPYLRAPMQDNKLCADCHTEATHEDINCLNCHQAHNTVNLKGIKQKVRASNYTSMPVVFLRYTGVNSFADGDSAHDGICEVCHVKTRYYRRNGSGFTNHSGGVNYDRKDCTACHSHSTGFAR